MNSVIRLGLVVSASANSVCVRVKPQTKGPDDAIYFVASEIDINAVVGPGSGLVIDPSSAAIDRSKFEITEVNLSGGGPAVNILGSNGVGHNQFEIVGSDGALCVPNNAVGNRFTGQAWNINGTGVNSSFDIEDTISALTLNAGNTGSIIVAPHVGTIIDNAPGSTNRVMTSSGDSYY